jgi:4a-hydroxytetrahydrobiopterin dehydratase
MSRFLNKKCVPCEGSNTELLLSPDQIAEYMAEIKDWKFDEGKKAITKEFIFKDFLKSMSFVESVADVAEAEGHHPDIYIFYNKVRLELSTHSVGGLTENDFIVASKIDSIWII